MIVSVEINGPKKYKVTYEYNGGDVLIPYEEVSSYDKLLMFQLGRQPDKEGYVFSYWYLDKDFTIPAPISGPITSDITLYAEWIPIEELDDQSDAKKSGCNAASIINLLVSLSASFGLVYIVKKKH